MFNGLVFIPKTKIYLYFIILSYFLSPTSVFAVECKNSQEKVYASPSVIPLGCEFEDLSLEEVANKYAQCFYTYEYNRARNPKVHWCIENHIKARCRIERQYCWETYDDGSGCKIWSAPRERTEYFSVTCKNCEKDAISLPGIGCRFECDSGLLAKEKEQCDTPVPECPYGLEPLAYPPTCKAKPNSNKGEGDCNSPDTTPAAGNPIRIATGNKYHVESVMMRALPLLLSYNSEDGIWHHNFDYTLTSLETTKPINKYIRLDGRTLFFENTDSEWKPLEAGAIQLSSTSAHGAAWLVNYYGQHEYYDDQGRILRIEKPQGKVQTFTWSDQQLIVQDQQSNRLTLTFDDKKRLTSAVQPNAKPVTLAWSDDNTLLKVTQPDGSIRQYHYENSTFPKHLTGITDGNGERFATWAYDDRGRAISSEHAGGNEKTTLEFHDNNSTTVTNPLGKKTTYYFQVVDGVDKVIKVEGPQTEHCAAANKAYTYYDNGLLKSKTDWKGMVTAFEYNDRGLETKRTVAVGTPNQYEVVTEWHDTLRLPTAKITRGERVGYRYDDKGRLIDKEGD